ncbi:MATE family efflux transporter [Hyunsoonleella pacifica]|uniref:Multidrug-efflux transporter n=1 Tax=Hyunsoonleella pacifica TaxID=1080224 RepID=A0A4Q9FN91_9FLAO|nr:MATE family efflux transporter [Hyunsoonleella pacifica]TBN14646.1 MATE family efflux transporter [Hyunsoonleella pacifica]GGD15519.1 MATE family efflux transporter [Hyunsoonleella pacifica]
MKSNISLKYINKLAVPALISGVSEPILSITDTAIVGNININPVESLAAVGIVGTFLSMLIWILGQTRSAISAIVSQYLGADNLEAVKNLPAQAIFIVTSLSVLIIIGTYPFTNQIFRLYNASGLILDYSIIYYQIRVFGFPFTLFTIAVFGTFRGLQNTYYPMIIAIIGAATNIILDFVLVYGISGYIPPMNIEGAAYASVIAQILMALFSAYFLLKKTTISLMPKFPFNKEITRFLLMILNLFIRTLALNITLYFATRFATGYGKNYIAAYTIAINLWFLGAFIIDGYAGAGNIMSGKLFGAKNYKDLVTLNKKLIKIGIIVGSILAIFGCVIYKPIGLLFTKEPEVLERFYSVFWIVLIMQPICAVAFIFDGIFKGLGKMSTLRNVLLGATFLVFIPILYTLNYFGFKLNGIFIALTLWMIARALPLLIYFNKQFIPLTKNN